MAKKKKQQSDGDGKPVKHGEQRSGPIAGTVLVDGATFQGKALQYANVDGQAIFEGDIVLGDMDQVRDSERIQGAERSVIVVGTQFRWPNATVPFEIDASLPNQQRVHDAIAHWQQQTRVRFRAKTASDANFVRFVPGSGCSSMVGMQGGAQNITLGSNCTAGNCIHEIGHTVGLWHEQSRQDRDTFVQVIWANIDPAMQHNFNQHISDGDDVGAYDYGSVMHYPLNAFTVNGQNTLVPRQTVPAGVTVGQRSGLSAGDIAGVAAMYGAVATIKETAKDPIAETVKEISKDPVQDTTLKEPRKDPVADTVKEVRKDPVSDTTIKEVRKDVAADPTVKEAAFDPINPGGPVINPGPLTQPIGRFQSPFVLAGPSRAMAGDAVADAQAQVQQLAQAIAQVEQQYAALVAAYDQAVQALNALQG
jgi:hypothetical protein